MIFRAETHQYGESADRALAMWVKLARAFSTFNRNTVDHIRQFGLTQAQFGALECLGHKGAMSIGALCRKQLVSGGNMTVVVDNLERDGLVERVRSRDDRRMIQVRLTPKGRTLFRKIFPLHALFVRETAAVLTEEEQNRLGALLKKLGCSLQEKESKVKEK